MLTFAFLMGPHLCLALQNVSLPVFPPGRRWRHFGCIGQNMASVEDEDEDAQAEPCHGSFFS